MDMELFNGIATGSNAIRDTRSFAFFPNLPVSFDVIVQIPESSAFTFTFASARVGGPRFLNASSTFYNRAAFRILQ
jgi:hypothetical protein